MFRAFRTRVWGIAALLSSALALAGTGPLTAQPPASGATGPEVTVNRSASSTDARAQARSKLLRARASLGQGNFEQAEALTAEVAALNLSYVASEDSPVKLTADLKKAKSDPKALLGAARAALARKDYDRAEKYARLADKNAGTFTFPVWSDSPGDVLKDVQAARKSAPKAKTEKAKLTKSDDKKETPKPAITQASFNSTPAVSGEDARAQAKSKLVEARKKLAQSDFDDAEAMAREVASMKLTYKPDEDSPAKVQHDCAKAKSDPKQLLATAKVALARKDYDKAEKFAKLADKNAGVSTFPIWSETPSDVLKQVAAARKTAPPKTAALPKAKEKEAPKETPVAKMTDVSPASPAKTQQQANADAEKARGLIKQARTALQAGKVEDAKRLTAQARDLKPNLNWWEDNPERLDADVHRTEGAQVKADGKAAPKPKDAKDAVAVTATEAPKTKDAAKAMLAKGRKQMSEGKLDEAFGAAQTVKSEKSLSWGLFEDSPDRLLVDVEKARTKRDREESERLLAEGRKLLEKGDAEGASKLAYRAQKLNNNYSVWDLGDRPSKLLADAQAAQAKKRKTELPPATLAHKDDKKQPAPKPPEKPVSQEPKTDAVVSNVPPPPPPGPPTVPTPSPTAPEPQKKNDTLVSNVPPPPLMQPPPTTPAATPEVPPAKPIDRDGPNKLQAQQLVAEAQRLTREGKLLEARQKAVEAQRLKAVFAGDEVSPELVYQQVATEARFRVDALVRMAHEEANYGTADVATRFQTAERRLGEAKQLAASFGQDVRMIDDKAVELRKQRDVAMSKPAVPGNAVVQASDPPPVPTPVQTPVQAQPDNQGQTLLEKARLELKKGELKMARTMCEEAVKTSPASKAETFALLRTIDAEEFNQTRLATNRAFDAAASAYRRGEHTQASAMVAAIDVHLLSQERQQRLREMALTPEMSRPAPTGTASASDQPGVKKSMPVPDAGMMRRGEDGLPGAPPEGTQLVSGEGKATATDKSSDVLDSYKTRQKILAQQLRSEGLAVQNAAAEKARAGNHQEAIDMLTAYLDTLTNKELEAGQLTVLRRPVDARISQYKLLKAQRDLIAGVAARRNPGMEEVKNRQTAEEMKHKNVERLMREFNALYREGKYAEAEGVAMRARELDPDNELTTAGIYMSRLAHNKNESQALKERKEDFNLKAWNQAEDPGPSGPITDGISFDQKRWEQIRKRKPYENISLGHKTDKEKAIERRLSSPVVVNFENASLKQVINDLRDFHEINIVPDVQALQETGISLESPVTIKLDQVSLKSALNLILSQVKLTYVIEDEVLKITTEQNAKGKRVPVTYPVADLVIPVDNFGDLQANSSYQANQIKQANGGTLTPPGYNPYAPTPVTGPYGLLRGAGVGSPAGSPYSSPTGATDGTVTNSGQPTVTKQRVTNTMEGQLITLITRSISPNSWNENGGQGTIEYYPLTLALVVNQTPDIQEQIQDLLAALRRLQDQEVAIEVRFITVSEDFFERIGVNFNVNILTDTTKFQPALVNNQFVSDPANFLNNINFGRFISGAGPGGNLTPTLDVPITNNSFFNTFPSYGRYIPGGGLSLGLAFLSDIQVFLFLEAVQGDVRSNLMQAPKLTMFNGQTATINASSFQSLITNVLVIPNGDGTFLFSPQVVQQPSGVQLTLQPAISADRRFVRVSLTPNFTSLKRDQINAVPVTVPIFTNADGQGGGGQPVLITQFIQTPNVVSLSVNTTVVVPDGGTVLMGGLKQLSEERSEYGPPILSKIPYVNRLFKNVGYGRSTDSLLIMVTPRIIIQEEEEERSTGFVRPGTPGP